MKVQVEQWKWPSWLLEVQGGTILKEGITIEMKVKLGAVDSGISKVLLSIAWLWKWTKWYNKWNKFETECEIAKF